MYTVALGCERVVGAVACSQPCGYGQLQEKGLGCCTTWLCYYVDTNHNDGEDY
jgi:hypothetical protein